MKKYKPQHSRLLFIDRKIGEGGYPNCDSLAKEWEVSRKTIQRDLDYMRYQLEVPLEYAARYRGYHYTEENFKLPALSIKESDLFAIYLAEELLLQHEGTPYFHSLTSVFKKIQDSLPDKTTLESPSENSRFTVFPPPGTTIRHDILESVFKGLRTLHRLKIHYQPPGQSPTSREIDPYHAIRYDGDWYVIGHCHLRDTIRTFSLSRINQASILEEEYVIPATFNFHQITRSRFGVHWGTAEEQVKIWFSPKVVPYILERTWHPSQKITYNDDQSLVLSLTVNHMLELKRWVLSWGKEARVLEPEKLAAEIRAEVGSMAVLYGDND
jgi:proteasome accessory factor B